MQIDHYISALLPALCSSHTTGPKAIAWRDLDDEFRLCVISAMYSGTTQLIAATL